MRRPQLTLRALLVAMLVVGAVLAWIEQQMSIVRERAAMIVLEGSAPVMFVRAESVSEWEASGVSWLRRQLGDRAIVGIVYYSKSDPHRHWLPKLKRLFPEAKIIETASWHCRS